MTNRTLRVAVIAIVALAVTAGCTPTAGSRSLPAEPPATSSPLPEAPHEPRTFGFEDGDSLPSDVEITMGDSLVSDVGWKELPPPRPGVWGYENVAGTCTATFRAGVLGAEPGMDDREASDAIIALKSGMSQQALAPALRDGHFPQYNEEGARITHRQFSIATNDGGYFIAARAFTSVDYSVEVSVTCEGTDLRAVAGEVLGKSAVEIGQL